MRLAGKVDVRKVVRERKRFKRAMPVVIAVVYGKQDINYAGKKRPKNINENGRVDDTKNLRIPTYRRT